MMGGGYHTKIWTENDKTKIQRTNIKARLVCQVASFSYIVEISHQ